MKSALTCLFLLVALPFAGAQQPAARPAQKSTLVASGVHQRPTAKAAARIPSGEQPGFNYVSTGLRVGDLIHSLNRSLIESVEQLKSALAKLKSGDAAVLRIERQGQLQYLAFEME